MKTELLIIKNNDAYIRVKENQYFLCALDKASVFPVDKILNVKEHVKCLKNNGFDNACIYRLILTEIPFEEK